MTTQNTLLFGAAGLLSLTALGGVALAQSSAQSSATPPPLDPVACSAALETERTTMGPAMDARAAAGKAAFETRIAALKDALALTDEAQRQTAIQAANKAFRQATTAAMEQFRTDTQAAREAMKASCPGLGRFGFGGPMMGKCPDRHGPGGTFDGMRGQGPKEDMLAQKLGITVEQLKSELQSGKTLQQIAEEHGITLPAGKREGWGKHRSPEETPSSSSETPQ